MEFEDSQTPQKFELTTPLVIGAVDAIANLEVDVEAQPAANQVDNEIPEAAVVDVEEKELEVEDEAPVEITVEPRRSARICAGVDVPMRFMHVTKVKKSEWGERDAELKQLLHEELNAL